MKASRKRMNPVEEKPLCKYGSSCYQKNSDHLQCYRHPSPKPTFRKEEPKNEEVDKGFPSKRKKTYNQQIPLSKDLSKAIKQLFLVEMPQDFYDFWEFCNTVDEKNPQGVFSDLDLHLVGPFDVLAKKFDGKKRTDNVLCHWRYYYDPPEFQTVIKKDGKDLYHIGYLRDDPKEMPAVVASNSAAHGPKLNLMGDNIFAAIDAEINKSIEKAKNSLREKFEKIKDDMKKFAQSKNYSLDVRTPKTKTRDKRVVAKTFHGLGIVVPYDKKNDVGYRPLPESDAAIKLLLKKIKEATTEEHRMKGLDDLQDIITNVQFANDECDYGMGLELGIDLFCFGDSIFHNDVLFLLPVAYELLRRPEFSRIIKAHLKDRKTGDNLSVIS